jgi:CheY-like chemotaxis protein
VLVVDDDDLIREVAQVALESVSGWTVLTADGGAGALAVLAEHRVDAVLLDVMMPDMDGLTTFRRMQDDPSLRDVPVVLVTAKVQSGPRPVWDGLAIAGVIPKPFDPMTLGEEVSAMLGWE